MSLYRIGREMIMQEALSIRDLCELTDDIYYLLITLNNKIHENGLEEIWKTNTISADLLLISLNRFKEIVEKEENNENVA